MRKVICVWLPTWPIDRLRRRLRQPNARDEDGSAIVLVAESHARLVVRGRCEAAATVGVCPGMALAHARALLVDHHLHVHPHQPKRDAIALAAIARWAHRLAPVVAIDNTHDPLEPDGLLLDVTGCERLYGSDDQILARVRRAFARIRLPARCALAPTIGAAWALARYGQTVEHDSLPVASLRLAPDVLDALAEVAIDTVGDLLAIPRRELFERFGEQPLRRIDQILGRVAEPVTPIRPVDPPRAHCVFNGPVTQPQAIELTVRRLLAELVDTLHKHSVGARRVVLHLERYDAADTRTVVTLAAPSADLRHLLTLWLPRVERLHLGHGVESITLIADLIDRLSSHQHTRWIDRATHDAAANDAALARWVDTLAARLGADRVCTVEPVATHVPHAAFRHRPFDCDEAVRKHDAAIVNTPLVDADRPSVMHDKPRPINVVTLNPDGPILSIAPHRDNDTVSIVRTIGPERIAGRWWRSPDPSRPTPQRDYFKLLDDTGRWWWVYREVAAPGGRHRWFCHGRWD